MKRVQVITSNSAEDKKATDEVYQNDSRTKPVSFGLYYTLECVEESEQNRDSSVQIIDNNERTSLVTVNREVAVMNEEQVTILIQIIQLITNSFVAEAHVQRDKKEPNGKNGIYIFIKSRTNVVGWYFRSSSKLYERASTKKRSY